MGQFKTVQTDNSIKRVFVDGYLKVNSVDKDKNYRVSLMLLNGKRNRNGWVYEGIAERLNQFVNIPILCALVEKNGEKKAGGHDFEIRKDPNTGEEYASFIGAESEHIIGWITEKTPDGRDNAYMENIDGVEWVCIREALLPSFYNKEFIDEMDKNGGTMRVSIETLVYKNRIEGDTEYEMDWACVGVTVISVTEAVAGAKIKRKVNAYSKELEEIKLKVASLNAETHIEPQTQPKNSKKGENRTMAEEIKAVETDLNSNSVSEPAVETETVETLKAKLNASNAALETLTAENAKLNEQIKAMRDAEMERRKNAVKDAIVKTMAMNAESFDCLDKNLCDDLLTDEKVSEYAAMDDGETRAESDVNARCMAKVREAQKVKANSEKKQYAWGLATNGEVEPEDEIQKAINKYDK